MKVSLTIIIFLVSADFVIGSPKKDCLTYDNHKGECVPLESCDSLKDFLQIPRHNSSFINNNLSCSKHDDLDMMVCCKTVDTQTLLPEECGIEKWSGELSNKKFKRSKKASIYQFPWIVLLEKNFMNVKVPICQGSLISSRYVITDAKCGDYVDSVIFGESNTKTLVDCQRINGSTKCNEPFLRIFIDEFLINPGYDQDEILHNIAMVRMAKKVPITDFIKPICLPTHNVNVKNGESLNFLMAGWQKQKDMKYIKIYNHLPYISLKKCKNSDRILNVILDGNLQEGDVICAGHDRQVNTPIRNSGGPLMYDENGRKTIVGVMSMIDSISGINGIPGVYVNVYNHIDWIMSVMRP